MDAQKVDMFIMANGKYFAEEKISGLRIFPVGNTVC